MKNETHISMKRNLSMLWITVMFLYIYADIQGFYETGFIAKVMTGNIDGMVIDQTFLFLGAILMSIPISMIFLTQILPAKLCRIITIILAFAHILLAIMVLFVGSDTGAFWYYYTVLEITSYIVMIVLSLKWKTGTDNTASSKR